MLKLQSTFQILRIAASDSTRLAVTHLTKAHWLSLENDFSTGSFHASSEARIHNLLPVHIIDFLDYLNKYILHVS